MPFYASGRLSFSKGLHLVDERPVYVTHKALTLWLIGHGVSLIKIQATNISTKRVHSYGVPQLYTQFSAAASVTVPAPAAKMGMDLCQFLR